MDWLQAENKPSITILHRPIYTVVRRNYTLIQFELLERGEASYICTITDNGVGIHQKQQQKKGKGKHVSKGISLLMKKVKTLNDLYHIHCELIFRDLSEQEVEIRGTEVILSYVLSK